MSFWRIWETDQPADVFVKDLKSFIPSIESVPQKDKDHEGGIVVVCKYRIPVSGITSGIQPCMEGMGGRVVWARMVRYDRIACGGTHHVQCKEVREENTIAC